MICTMFKIKRSMIHGKGLHAGIDLLPDTWVRVYVTELPESQYDYRCIHDEENECCWLPSHPFCFLNHSDHNNADLVWEDNNCYLHIQRLIPAGHEITINYGPETKF